jgi:hypothetical protein
MGSTPLPPDLQTVLEQLFELFSQYTATSDRTEQAELRTQILSLFARLGVATKEPLVQNAIAIFERISGSHVAKRIVRETLPIRARDFVTNEIRGFERQSGLKLSGGARQILRVPIVESVEFTETFREEQTHASLQRVFSSLSESPQGPSEGSGRKRSSIAVIRAYWKNFCNIPPICRGHDGE